MSIVDFSLKNKVAVINGGSRGIGLAIARGFSEQGAKVVLASRKQEDLDKAADTIKTDGGEALAVAAHAGKMEDIEALFQKVKEVYGRVDILVNNAATNPFFGAAIDISESAYDKTFEVNSKGYFFMIQHAARMMQEQGDGGSIINVASAAGFTAPPMQGVYGMTKAAVIMMTKVFARELALDKIRCNCICPGIVKTQLSRALWENPDVAPIAVERVPLGRFASPEEMVGLAVYLASDASSYTTGSIILADGGLVT